MNVVPLLILFFLFHRSALVSAVTYNVVTLGAEPDGKTDSTRFFLAAWNAACGSTRPATIYVPRGRFLLRNAAFSGSNCKNSAITMQIDGTLVAPSNYRVIGSADNWLGFQDVTGLTILGGVLDAQGTSLWACKSSGNSCPDGATVCVFLPFTKKNTIFFQFRKFLLLVIMLID